MKQEKHSSEDKGAECVERIFTLEMNLENLQKRVDHGSCTLAQPGRGDCKHAIGLPGRKIPNQHDGPDDTVDAYGKPNGWCWSCWRSYQLEEVQGRLAAQAADIQKLVFIRDLMERAERAEMDIKTTDRFIVHEVQRILKQEE